MLRDVDQSKVDEERIRREMDAERSGLTSAGEVIADIENAFLKALLKVGPRRVEQHRAHQSPRMDSGDT